MKPPFGINRVIYDVQEGEETMAEQLRGSCLCGQVSFQVSGPFRTFYTCHCRRCRKATGSSNAANIFAAPDSVVWISGEHLVTHFALSEASFFNAAFCRVCGAHVPRRARSGDFVIIPAGCLDDDPPMAPDHAIFWSDRTAWYEESCRTKRYDGYAE
jgi:hypothetical protein